MWDSEFWVDPQVSQSNGYLRSLPLLSRVSRVKFDKVVTWEAGKNCKVPLAFSTDSIGYVSPSAEVGSGVHCVYANDETEEKFGHLAKYVESGRRIAVVVDHEGFIPSDWESSGKPVESKFEVLPKFYLREFNRYVEAKGLSAAGPFDPKTSTRNLALFEAGELHWAITGRRPKSPAELLDFQDDRLCISPIWVWAERLIKLKQENVVSNRLVFIFNALRPSIEINGVNGEMAKEYRDALQRFRWNGSAIQRQIEGMVRRCRDELVNLKLPNSHLQSLLSIGMEMRDCH